MVLPSVDDGLTPGVRVRRDPHPLEHAKHLARRFDAHLCVVDRHVDALMSERAAYPLLDEARIHELELLAERIITVDRIAAATYDRAVLAVTGSLGQPSTRELADARAAVRAVEDELAALPTEPAVVPPSPAGPADVLIPEVRPSRRWLLAAAVVAAAVLVAAALVIFDLAPVWSAPILPLAASTWAVWHLKRGSAPDSATLEASSLLASVSAAADEVFEARKATVAVGSSRQALMELHALRTAELRTAEQAADELRELVVRTPSVRAIYQRSDALRARWQELWSSGTAPVPPAEDGVRYAREAASVLRRPIVVAGAATARVPEIARAAPAAAVIVVDEPVDLRVGAVALGIS